MVPLTISLINLEKDFTQGIKSVAYAKRMTPFLRLCHRTLMNPYPSCRYNLMLGLPLLSKWMKQSTFTLIILFNIYSYKSPAQTRHLKFDKITGSKGVALGTVNAIAQDKFGFIWFSDETNHCITRYDGSSMKRYKHDPTDPNSFGGMGAECLATDSTGAIWIGYDGLDRFDPLTETFTHYRHDPKDPESLSNGGVNAVVIDHLGKVWVGTDVGLDLLDQTTGKFTHYRHKEGDSTSLSFDKVRAVYEDRAGTIWIGTGFTNKAAGGLNRLDRNTGIFSVCN